MPLLTTGAGAYPAAGGGDAAQTTAFLARTSGLSGTETNAYKALINGLVADGDFTKLDVLYIFATNTQTTALLNLISTSFGGTTTGTVSFSADHGYTGDSSTFSIDSGFNGTTASGNFITASKSIGVYQTSSRTTGQTWIQIGNSDGTLQADIFSKFGDGNAYSQFNGNASGAVANAQGMTVGVQLTATTSQVWKNNSLLGSGTPSGGGMANLTITIFAQQNIGAPLFFCGDQLSAAFIGSGGINVANVSARINTYMTALSINVY